MKPALPLPPLYRQVWPLFLELGSSILVGWVGTALAARLSDSAAAAFSLSNHLGTLLFILFRIIGAGISVVQTQALGSGQRRLADESARASLGAGSWIGLLTAAAALLGAGPLLHLMEAPDEVILLARPLLQALSLSLLLDAWNSVMASVLRAHLRARDTLMVLLISQALQLACALPLMRWLGLPGFALALSLGRGAGLLLHLLLWRERLDLRLRNADWWRLHPALLKPVLRIGIPGAAENLAYRGAFMVSIAVTGRLGAQALAAHAYASQLMYLVLLFGLATGVAVEVLVGHLISAGRLHEAHRLVRGALLRGLAVSLFAALAAALLSPWLFAIFSQDAALIRQATLLMWLTVLLEPGRTFNLVVINALRAAGDARYPVLAGAGSMALVLAGGSWLLGEHLGLGLAGIWLAYAADEWLRGLLMWRRWCRLAWLPHARAIRRQHRAHRDRAAPT